jgi:hypothetical protein
MSTPTGRGVGYVRVSSDTQVMTRNYDNIRLDRVPEMILAKTNGLAIQRSEHQRSGR